MVSPFLPLETQRNAMMMQELDANSEQDRRALFDDSALKRETLNTDLPMQDESIDQDQTQQHFVEVSKD